MSEGVRRVATKEQALEVFDDRFLRWQMTPLHWCGAWVTDRAIVIVRSTESSRSATVLGEAADAARLLSLALDQAPPNDEALRLTVDTRIEPALPDHLRPAPESADRWEWMWTDSAPAPVAGESAVTWVEADQELRTLLYAANPRHHGRPGDPHLRGWVGVRDNDGRLVAIGALNELDTGIPHLQSISVDPAARGRGWAAAVSAFLTRHALEGGAPVVTLGLYSDNATARRLYRRLGYRVSHAFVSGPLRRSTTASVRSA